MQLKKMFFIGCFCTIFLAKTPLSSALPEKEPSSEMDSWKKELVQLAVQARKKSYSPYSHFAVGAAIKTKGGKIYTGTNVENASYGMTICAERCAAFRAVAEGSLDLEAIAISLKAGGSPCGACRQVLNEFNPNILILIGNEDGSLIQEKRLSELLPEAFGPKNLE